MNIKKARKLIGKTNSKHSDTEILEMIDTAKLFTNIAIDMFSKMKPEEIEKFH